MKARLTRWLARIRAVFHGRALDADFDAELAEHLELQTADYIKAGIAPAEARRRAHVALGGVQQARELHREARGLPWLEQFVRDLAYAARMLRRERGFALIALTILAIGIGLNTTVFSLVNTVLLRPIPFAHADRLVWITNGDPTESSHNLSAIASRVDTWEGLQETSRTLEQIEAYNPFSVRRTYRLTGEGEPETVLAVEVSTGLFDMLGVKPALGRLFVPEDGVKNAPDRVMLSHEIWQRRYGGDPRIVGRTIRVNDKSVEVIGVLPRADAFTSVFFPAVRVDAYAPLIKDDARHRSNTVALIARARPSLTIDAVRSDLKLSVSQLKQRYPDRNPYFSANAFSLHDWVAGSLRRPLVFLWIAAGLLLAIVSFNLGGLLLARGAARQKELALRCALGAGRMRIVGQLLTESFALVGAGSFLGVAIAWGAIHLLTVRSSVEIPLLQTLHLDPTALGFTVLLCVLTVGLCGALPTWRLGRVDDIPHALKEDGRTASEGRQRSRLSSALVVMEVALACLLAISAGLMVRGFVKMLRADLGFRPTELIAIRIDPAKPRQQESFLDVLLERVRALPGVEQAGLTDCVPVERDRSWSLFPVNPDNPDDRKWTGAHIRIVSPGLFASMGIPLRAGRDFTRLDDRKHPNVIVINRTLAERFWPGENAVGRQVNVNGRFPCTVIAVASDVRHGGPEAPAGNEMYLSMYQEDDAASWDLMVRTNLPVTALAAGLRESMRDVDAGLPLSKARPMQVLVDRTLSSRRLLVWLISGFATIAVGLAALGLYGVISYGVTQRTREIGIRMALGAPTSLIRWQVVGRTIQLAGGGLVLGLIASALASRWLRSLLFELTPIDGATYFVVAMALLVCAGLAGYLPARRASSVDPLVCLRAE